MNIVINTIPIFNDRASEKVFFFKACINQLIINNPTESFYLIMPAKNTSINTPPNQINLNIAPTLKNVLLWKFWYNYNLPKILKKQKAAVFLNIDSFCNIKIDLPQYLLVSDFTSFNKIGFSKKKTIESINKAALLITHSETEKQKLIKQYLTDSKKILVLPLSADDKFKPASDFDKELTKEAYTDGKEYFLFSGEIDKDDNLINLLKAFSLFKKRLKSNMQLVITTKKVLPKNFFIKSLASYKYREEIKILFDLPQQEIIKITAAAYLYVWPVYLNNNILPVLQAVQCGVPIIVNDTALMKEICSEAALYTIADDYKDLADKMMLLYKDENKRMELIVKGKQQTSKNTLNQSAEILWQYLLNCAGTTL